MGYIYSRLDKASVDTIGSEDMLYKTSIDFPAH